ncbi:UPF0415 protein C7orf25 homolog [Antedon mediterranea]|uniref:UPF0415 protein C7orf25 homolog n=1 Tax=Antedon mediterranea TaxID=105859 RepID=UPI003AF85D6A
MESIQPLIDKAHELIQRAEQLQLKEPSVRSVPKLSKRIKAELNFLHTLQSGDVELKENQLQSTNLTHLEAVLSAAESFPGVSDIFSAKHATDEKGNQKTLVIDVIANHGAIWVKVTARRGHALYRVWQGEGDYGDKDIVEQALEYNNFASSNPVKFIVPKVHVMFLKGLPSEVKGELESVGIATHGHVLSNSDDHRIDVPCFDWSVLEELKVIHAGDPRRNRVNLDVSTMIAMTSNLTHNGCWFDYPECLLINDQAIEERCHPQLTALYNILKGKQLFACSTAITIYKGIVSNVAGPMEQARAKTLLTKVTIVDDCVSKRTQELGWSNKIKERPKIIFGTGDALEMVTVSANGSFIRSASKHNITYAVDLHQSRTFTERKEAQAVTIKKDDSFKRINLEQILKDLLNPS